MHYEEQVLAMTFPEYAAYAQRVAESWGVGQKDKRNGVVLLVFVEDRKMIIQVGYGLEGALPDVTAFNITEEVMKCPQQVIHTVLVPHDADVANDSLTHLP